MSGHTQVIMFISAMLLVSVAIVVFNQTGESLTTGNAIVDSSASASTLDEAYISQISVTDVYDSDVERVRVEVIGGQQPLVVDELDLLVRTGTAGKRYAVQQQ